MRARQIRKQIEKCITLFEFEYNGKVGNVDPYFLPEKNQHEYLLFFDNEEQTVYDIDAVMATHFIDGHSLNEIAEQLIITDC